MGSEARSPHADRAPFPFPRAGGRRAATLVEVLLAILLFSLVLYGAYNLWMYATRHGARIEEGLETAGALRVVSARVTREVREACRLFYPVLYGQTGDGVGFVDMDGQAVMVHTNRTAPAGAPVPGGTPAPLQLIRTVLTTGKSETILEDLESFRVTLHPVHPGQEPSYVTLVLSIREAQAGLPGKRVQTQITKIFLRNLERRFPAQ